MLLKFLQNGETYECDKIEYIDAHKIKVTGKDIPSLDGGFEVINNGISDNLYHKYITFFDKKNNDVIFTSENTTYYTYLLFDKITKYIIAQITTTEMIADGILQFSGKTAEFANPESKVLFDQDGFNLYKLDGDEIVNTTAADKQAWSDKKNKEEYEKALKAKLSEINAACKTAIINGVYFGDSHYSYNSEDQSNISNATTLAIKTGLAVPYHADGESCRLFEKDEIVGLYVAEETNLTHNITYYNQLKFYIQTLTTKTEIEEIVYGVTELTGEYLETYNMIMAQSKEVIKKFIEVE